MIPFLEPTEESKENYKQKVLSRNRSPLYASLDWLKESGAITEEDIESLNEIKDCRNQLAHDLLEGLTKNNVPDLESRFSSMLELLHKIEVWWIVNVELATNPDFYDKEVDENEILTGPVMMLKILIDVALGDEKESSYYYNEFLRKTKSQPDACHNAGKPAS
jgi:hypothetical protein